MELRALSPIRKVVLCTAVLAFVIIALLGITDTTHSSPVFITLKAILLVVIFVSFLCQFTESSMPLGLYALIGCLQVLPSISIVEMCKVQTDLLPLYLHLAFFGLYILHCVGTRIALTVSFLALQMLVVNVAVLTKEFNYVGATCTLPSPTSPANSLRLVVFAQVLLLNTAYALLTLNSCTEALAEAQVDVMHQTVRQQSDSLLSMQKIFSHEFKTPLNISIGQCSILAADPNPEVAEGAQMVAQSLREIQDKINAILDYTEIMCAREPLPLILAEFDLRDHVSFMLEPLASQASNKQVRLLLDVDPSVPRYVVGDEQRMKKVIDPIVHNAIKFSSTGQKVHVTVSFVETEARRFLQYKVTDEGCGMDPEQQSQALEPFCNSEYEGGLGLGLNIALLMIDSLGGCLGINSPGIGLGTDVMVAIPLEVGGTKGCPSTLTPSFFFKLHESCSPILRQQLLWLDCKIWDEHCGSDFDVLVLDSDFVELSSFQKSTCPIINITSDATLRNPSGIERHAIVVKPVLPNKLRDAIRTHVSAGSDETAEGQETRKRALVVDDIRLNRMLLIKNLAMKMKMKIDFDEAQNGVEALHLAMSSAHVYDIVLLDCNMPIMDGFETAQSLRELPRYKNIPIFAVTANDSIFDHAKCFSSGMDRVISKPVNFPALVQEIHTAFEYPNERPSRMLCISDCDRSTSPTPCSSEGRRPDLHKNLSGASATAAHAGLRRSLSVHPTPHPGLPKNPRTSGGIWSPDAHPGLTRNLPLLDTHPSVYTMALQPEESMSTSHHGTSLRPALHRNMSNVVAHPGLRRNMSNIVAHPGLRRNMSNVVAHPGLDRNMSSTTAHPGLRRNPSKVVAHPGLDRNMSNIVAHPGLGRNMSNIVAHPGLGRNMSNIVAHPGLDRNMSNIVAHPGPGRIMSNILIPSGLGGNMLGHAASGQNVSGVTEQAGLHRNMPSGTCPARQLPSPPREFGFPDRSSQECMISGDKGRSSFCSLPSPPREPVFPDRSSQGCMTSGYEGRSGFCSLQSWSFSLPKLQVHNVLTHSSSAPVDCPLRTNLAVSRQEGRRRTPWPAE